LQIKAENIRENREKFAQIMNIFSVFKKQRTRENFGGKLQRCASTGLAKGGVDNKKPNQIWLGFFNLVGPVGLEPTTKGL
jgi:hypothetical protein